MSTIPTNRESDRFMLRLPDGMRDRIKAKAEANNRSMNAEIVATLEERYPAPLDTTGQALLAAVEMINDIDPESVNRFVQEYLKAKLASGEITEEDIVNGLIPGVTVVRK